MAAPVAVGVDNGGTWIRLKGLNADGRCIWSLKKPSPSVDKLPAFLKRHLRHLQGKLSTLAVGSRGVWKPSKRRALRRALRGLAKTIVVMSDVEAAWLAAFQREGIIVIAGTGSIAYGKRRDGKFARAGGLGPDKGDGGSGYWIGRMWLPETSKKKNTVRDVAALAPVIIRKAQKGNPKAREIIRTAQMHLSALVIELARNLSWKGTIPVSVSGSVLENSGFQRGFFHALRKNKIHFQIVRRKMDQTVAPLMGLSVSWHQV